MHFLPVLNKSASMMNRNSATRNWLRDMINISEQFQRYGRDICSKNLKYKFSENANVNNIQKHLLIFV